MLRSLLSICLLLPGPAAAAPVARVVLAPRAVPVPRLALPQPAVPVIAPKAVQAPQPTALAVAQAAVAQVAAVSADAPAEQAAAAADFTGKLIVVEGLDGSGKSTQLDMLKEQLEARGHKVVVTRWNSSEVVSSAVKAAKKQEKLTPKTFALLNAADLSDRLQKTVVPALKEGAIVLADRWTYTSLARDVVRGNDRNWLRKLYDFAPKPDLVLYFKLPAKLAIDRVLARGEASLSEDHGSGIKHYEAGLDVGPKHATELEHFEWFQTRVAARYDEQSRAREFRVIDATRDRQATHEEVLAQALRVIEKPARGAAAFLAGGFVGQFANAALTVTLPLAVALHFDSPAAAAVSVGLAMTLSSAADSLGVVVGGLKLSELPAKPMLIGLTALRAAILAGVAFASLPVAIALFAADGLVRGLLDNFKNDLPFRLGGGALIGRFQAVNETGRILGALGLGALMLAFGAAALWAAPLAFLVSAGVYALLPASRAEPAAQAPAKWSLNPWFISMLVAGLFFTLKGLLPGLYATALLSDPVSTAWLFAAFAGGTIAGSLVQPKLDLAPSRWAMLSALGIGVLALGWLPMSLWPLLAAVFVFAALNGASKAYFESTFLGGLAGKARRQALAAKRTATNVFSLAAKSGAALLLAAVSELWAFGLLSGAFLAAAAYQWNAGRRLTPPAAVVEAAPVKAEPPAGARRFLDAVPDFPAEVREGWKDEKQGFHNFQRNMTTLIQERFVALGLGEGSPTALLHGNPSLNNLLNLQLEDSDRAAVGPATWDLFRPLLSFAAWRKDVDEAKLPAGAAQALIKGYARGWTQGPHLPYAPDLERLTKPAKAKTTKEYIKSELKWVKELRANPIPADDPELLSLLRQYRPGLLEAYKVKEAGRSRSWVRGRRRIIVALKPLRGGDWLMVDLKEVHPAPAAPGFSNPFPTEGERMIAVNDLYSPGAVPLQGLATDAEGRQYWGHQIVVNDRKPGKLSKEELEEVAMGIGYQLGRGHRLALRAGDLAQVEALYPKLVKRAEQVLEELREAYRNLP